MSTADLERKFLNKALSDPDSLSTSDLRRAFYLSAAGSSGEPGDSPGVVVDKTVGTRVYIDGILVYGDTGWRDIRSLMVPADIASVDLFMIRRIGNMVTVACRALTPSSAGTISLFPIETPGLAFTGTYELREMLSGSGQFQVQAAARRYRLFGDSSQIRSYSFTMSYPVSTAWPTSLPGEAA